MLSRIFNRPDAETQLEAITHRRPFDNRRRRISFIVYISLSVCISTAGLSCSSKPTDLRSLAPADSLIYLETNDLGAALRPIVDSPSFNEAAAAKPELSAIDGIQMAIAVTGFEAAEEQLNAESSVLSFKPHFVVIADTHAWGWQTNSFAEDQLGEFVNKLYGGGVRLETTPKDGGTGYVWTSEDGRRSFGFVVGSLILFSNDESAIERVQSVRRGDTAAFSKSGKDVPAAGGDTIAVGYVSKEGIGQLANIVGAQRAKESGEEVEVQSFVARVLPQVLRGSINEVVWTANKTGQGIDDRLAITLEPEIARVFSETFAASENVDNSLLRLVPSDVNSITQYQLKDPQIAWRSILLTVQKLTDPASGSLVAALSDSFFEPYGVSNGEGFLGAVAPGIVTVRYDDSDDVAVIARTRDQAALAASIDKEEQKDPGGLVRVNQPGLENVVVAGDPETTAKCTQALQNGQNFLDQRLLPNETGDKPAAIRTFGTDRDTAVLLASVLSERRSDEAVPVSRFIVETRFRQSGMQRRLISEFGLISSIVTMLAAEE